MNIDIFRERYSQALEADPSVAAAMFAFGMIRGNSGLKSHINELDNPLKDRLAAAWDQQIWLNVIRAVDDEGNDEDELYSKEGIDYKLYQLEIAVINNRPDWALFYLTGEAFGELDDHEMTAADFGRFMQQLPQAFRDDHSGQLKQLFRAFGGDGTQWL